MFTGHNTVFCQICSDGEYVMEYDCAGFGSSCSAAVTNCDGSGGKTRRSKDVSCLYGVPKASKNKFGLQTVNEKVV